LPNPADNHAAAEDLMRRLAVILSFALLGAALAAQGARYLVITTDPLQNSVQPLAQWKHAKGMQCKVVPLSQIGSDTASIRNYIRNAWNTWPVRPEFVLLVGSPSSLPSRHYSLMHGESYDSDNIYGDVSGDFRMDIPVGRLPARTVAQLDVIVAKTLLYDKTPDLTDTAWMRRLTTVCRDLGDDDAYIYWSDIRFAAGLARAAGFLGCDSLASSRGDTAPDVEASVNAGTGLVMYRGTGTGNWYRPFAVNPANCRTNRRLPIVLSFTCATMTLTPGESMVGDAWVKAGTVAEPRGAVAFIGNTHSSVNVARDRSAVARGFFMGLFNENRWHLGHSLIRAKQQLYQEFPQNTSDYRGFNLLGDPELGVWTNIPQPPQVTHPFQIMPGQQTVSVAVNLAGAPFDSALVCLSMDTAVYAYGYTDAQGSIGLSVNPIDTGRMRIVVTGKNLYPYDTAIHVGEVGLAEHTAAPLPQSRLVACPAMFTGRTRLTWPVRAAAAVSIYNACGVLVRTLAGPGSADWNGLDDRGLPCDAGIYLARLQGSSAGTARLVKLD
jgi:hypothetical protein